MLNTDKILAHRGIILTALKLFQKGLEGKVLKNEEEYDCDSSDTEDKIATVKMLCGEFVDQRAMILENTPMGDALTQSAFTTDDGTVLTADVLDELLNAVGVDAPLDHITAWTLDQRKQVHAWIKAQQIALLDGTTNPLNAPEIIAEDWFTDADSVLEREMSEDDVDQWIGRGPWGVRAGSDPTVEEWEITKTDPADPSLYISAHDGQKYGQLDRARLIAANMNAMEEGRKLAAAHKEPEPLVQDATVAEETSTTGPALVV